jgi:hypothetical protein
VRVRYVDNESKEGELDLSKVKMGDRVRFREDYRRPAGPRGALSVREGEIGEVLAVYPESLRVRVSGLREHSRDGSFGESVEDDVPLDIVAIVVDARDPRISNHRITSEYLGGRMELWDVELALHGARARGADIFDRRAAAVASRGALTPLAVSVDDRVWLAFIAGLGFRRTAISAHQLAPFLHQVLELQRPGQNVSLLDLDTIRAALAEYREELEYGRADPGAFGFASADRLIREVAGIEEGLANFTPEAWPESVRALLSAPTSRDRERDLALTLDPDMERPEYERIQRGVEDYTTNIAPGAGGRKPRELDPSEYGQLPPGSVLPTAPPTPPVRITPPMPPAAALPAAAPSSAPAAPGAGVGGEERVTLVWKGDFGTKYVVAEPGMSVYHLDFREKGKVLQTGTGGLLVDVNGEAEVWDPVRTRVDEQYTPENLQRFKRVPRAEHRQLRQLRRGPAKPEGEGGEGEGDDGAST